MVVSKPNKTVIIIAGPTAVGKTATAISVAKNFNTEIISADSRQCYKELNIGVARPSPEQLKEVPHHFIASHSINEEVNADIFEKYALKKTSEIHQQHDTVVIVGGTGLYIKAFTDGLDIIPAIDPEIRKNINEQYLKNGLGWLQQQVMENDPVYYASGEMQNPQRMIRALEVVQGTGQSILSFRKGEKAIRNFDIIKIALDIPKEELHQNIYHRTDEMIRNGLVEEVQNLKEFKDLNALKTVGYAEVFKFLDHEICLAEAAEQIKINTRKYAKRQLTWFKKDKEYNWFSPVALDLIIEHINLKRFVKN